MTHSFELTHHGNTLLLQVEIDFVYTHCVTLYKNNSLSLTHTVLYPPSRPVFDAEKIKFCDLVKMLYYVYTFFCNDIKRIRYRFTVCFSFLIYRDCLMYMSHAVVHLWTCLSQEFLLHLMAQCATLTWYIRSLLKKWVCI